jgi:universal stress protein E
MQTLERLLVVVDPDSDARPSLERAAWLNKHCGARVELFICAYDPILTGDRKAVESQLDHHRDLLETLAAGLRSDGIEVDVDARWDHPFDEGVVRKMIASAPDLVLKDTSYHSLIRRTVFSNTDWNLIRNCPAPLWLVKSRDYTAPMRVLAAVDPMHEHDKPAALDAEILATAQRIADLSDGDLHVAHVFDSAPIALATSAGIAPAVPAAAQPSLDVIESLMKGHRKALDTLLEGRGLEDRQIHFERGAIAEALPDLADSLGAHLVVLGAVSRGALKRVLIGSTAERVLDRLPCDLLVVKPPAFATRIEAEA